MSPPVAAISASRCALLVALLVTLLAVLTLPFGATANTIGTRDANLVQIDDHTAYDSTTDMVIEHRAPTPVDPTNHGAGDHDPTDHASHRPQDAPTTRATTLDEGLIGCSTTDSANPFALADNSQSLSIDLLPEGNYPYDATMRPDASEVWIPGATGDGVIVIDRTTNAITHRIAVGDYPVSVAFNADASLALVANRDSDNVSIVSTSTYNVVDTLVLGLGSSSGMGNLALDPATGHIWGVHWFDEELFELAGDGSSVLNTYTIGERMWQVVVAPDGQYVYCTDRGTDQVHVFDPGTGTVFTSVGVGDDPWGLDIVGDGTQLVVSCEDDATVHFISTSTFLATSINLPSDADPRDVDILDATGTGYVTGGTTAGGSPVYLIDLESNTLDSSFLALDTNTNVIAVQPQVSGGTTAVEALEPDAVTGAAPRAALTAASLSPNPFNPHTTLEYTVTERSAVRVSVYDARGRLVATLVDGERDAGSYEVTWNGTDAAGNASVGGVYFLRLDAGLARRTLKAVLAK